MPMLWEQSFDIDEEDDYFLGVVWSVLKTLGSPGAAGVGRQDVLQVAHREGHPQYLEAHLCWGHHDLRAQRWASAHLLCVCV